MVVKILGGHGGVSPGFRATSFLIDGKILIDAGAVAETLEIAEQALIEDIFISHAHLDHTCQMAYLFDNCFGLNSRPFEVHANAPVMEAIKKHLFNNVIWPDFSTLPNKDKPTVKYNVLTPGEGKHYGDYHVLPIQVNHNGGAVGFIFTKDEESLVFTLDTAATDQIWKESHKCKKVVGIFTEVSFPNHMQNIADLSLHHTPQSLEKEIDKMPRDCPIYISHLKPNFLHQLEEEISNVKQSDRVEIVGPEIKTLHF